MRLRVLHLVTRADLAGAQRYVLLCAARSPGDMVIGAGSDGPLMEEARRLGCRCEIVPGLSKGLDPRLALRALDSTTALIRRHRPHLVHTHTSNAGVIGRLAARRTGTPAVHTAHGWQFAAGNRLGVRAVALASEWLMAPFSSAVICVCQADADLARRLAFPYPERLEVVLNAVPDRRPLRTPGTCLRLGMAARFAGQKDQATLIAAVRSLDGVECHLWGDGPTLPACRAAAAGDQRIHFHGEQRDVPALLGGVDVMVLATHYEGLPLCLLEGLAAGLPLIATAVNGVPETIRDGWNGRLVPPRDVSAMADAIRAYRDDAGLVADHGAHARSLFQECFSADRFHLALAEVYRKALARAGRLPHLAA